MHHDNDPSNYDKNDRDNNNENRDHKQQHH
jgi:hypothetical protein